MFSAATVHTTTSLVEEVHKSFGIMPHLFGVNVQ
jgi:hypothetical protein